MKNFLVYTLVFLGYFFLANFVLNAIFYGVLEIRPTFLSFLVQFGIIISFWYFVLRDRLFGPGRWFGPK